MNASQIKQSKTRHQVWIDVQLYENILALRIRDESWGSIVGFLYEFYNAHKDEVK